jgi:phosphatidylglycerol:prolipoprotein diacylglycerol transferase
MHPILFTWQLPEWLSNLLPFLPQAISPRSYGTLIALGILASWAYGTREAKKLGIHKDTITDMFVYLILAGFVGGKVLFYLEDPSYYFSNGNWYRNLGSGFVFYGSFLFALPTLWWFFRKHKLPTLPMIDIIAIGGAMVHMFGRMGCFMAGCCHGIPTNSWLGVTFTNPACSAKPLGTPLHPTQLYSVGMLVIIIAILFIVKKHKKFPGQLFPVYLALYSAGRFIIEFFRGDDERGYVLDGGWLTHSQLISLVLFPLAMIFYFWLKRKSQSNTAASPQ